MDHFLARLAARTLGRAPLVRPAIGMRFETGPTLEPVQPSVPLPVPATPEGIVPTAPPAPSAGFTPMSNPGAGRHEPPHVVTGGAGDRNEIPGQESPSHPKRRFGPLTPRRTVGLNE
jgi:hypothetical protein